MKIWDIKYFLLNYLQQLIIYYAVQYDSVSKAREINIDYVFSLDEGRLGTKQNILKLTKNNGKK